MDAPDAPSTPYYSIPELELAGQVIVSAAINQMPATKMLPEAWAHVLFDWGSEGVSVVRGPEVFELPEVVRRREAYAVLVFEPIRLRWLRMASTVVVPDGAYGRQAAVGVSGGKWRLESTWEPIANCRRYRTDVQRALREVRAGRDPDR